MTRSTRKGPFVEVSLLKKVEHAKSAKKQEPIKTWYRKSMVTPDFVGLTIMIHNGKSFIPAFITENMVGHKLGEFAHTRTFRRHGGITKMTSELT